MPSKKRKYNARFPAGRIKKIMQTDEEVGKVAQAVPIIISRTLELFVESLLSKAMRVTMARSAKTLSPSHVKQCILSESRFDFLRDLVQNIPDVSAAEEKEMLSTEDSPISARVPEAPTPRRFTREDSSSSTSSEVRPRLPRAPPPARSVSLDPELHRPRAEVTSTIVSTDIVMDLSKKPVRTANFYQETLTDEVQHHSVITPNPTYASPQPSTSSYTSLTSNQQSSVDFPVPKSERKFFVDVTQNNNSPVTAVTPILNIDFSKSLAMPEIKVLGSNIAPNEKPRIQRQNSKQHVKRIKPTTPAVLLVDLDHLNSGNLQIDEDYDT